MRRVDAIHEEQATLREDLAVAKVILERIESHLAKQNGRVDRAERDLRGIEKTLNVMAGREEAGARMSALWRPSIPAFLAGAGLLLLGMVLRSVV